MAICYEGGDTASDHSEVATIEDRNCSVTQLGFSDVFRLLARSHATGVRSDKPTVRLMFSGRDPGGLPGFSDV